MQALLRTALLFCEVVDSTSMNSVASNQSSFTSAAPSNSNLNPKSLYSNPNPGCRFNRHWDKMLASDVSLLLEADGDR